MSKFDKYRPDSTRLPEFEPEFSNMLEVGGLTTLEEIDQRRMEIQEEIRFIVDERHQATTDLNAAVDNFRRGGGGLPFNKRKELADTIGISKAKLLALNSALTELKSMQRRFGMTMGRQGPMTDGLRRTLAHFVCIFEEENGVAETKSMLAEADRRHRAGMKAMSAALREYDPDAPAPVASKGGAA